MDTPQSPQIPQTPSLNPDSNADRPQAVGLTTVMDAVEGVRFPISRDALIDVAGDHDVDLTGQGAQPLRVLLLRCDPEAFVSVTDLVQRLVHAL